jgi:hypothetical protein
LKNYKKLSEITICDNDIIRRNVKHFKIKINDINRNFTNYNTDTEKIYSNEQFIRNLSVWLRIDITSDDTHETLINKIQKENEIYNEKTTLEYLSDSINNEELFTSVHLLGMPIKKLIKVQASNNKYYCFDIIVLRQYVSQKNEYVNPYTNTKFSHDDIIKINNFNINKIKYFCGM